MNSADEPTRLVVKSDQQITRAKQAVDPNYSLNLGAVIKQRFVIESKLGGGGMGIVYRATDLRRTEAGDENPHIAIKVIAKEFAGHPAAFSMLQQEAKKTQALSHPHIVTVFDFDRDESMVFMTMEELRGNSLDQVIYGDTPVALNTKNALRIIREIAIGLGYAHSKGIIHSDLKPANVFITQEESAKILDFGIARAIKKEADSGAMNADALLAMTPAYASLEMFDNSQPSPADDIYALGLIACELIGQKHPYGGLSSLEADKRKLKATLPKAAGWLVNRVLKGAIERDAGKRISSIDDFVARLDFATQGYKKRVMAMLVASVIAIANLYYWTSIDSDIPDLSKLPVAEQQKFHALIKEANNALDVGDVNGALFYLDDAFAIHPHNPEIESMSGRVLDFVKTASSDESGHVDTTVLNEHLALLKVHPVFERFK